MQGLFKKKFYFFVETLKKIFMLLCKLPKTIDKQKINLKPT